MNNIMIDKIINEIKKFNTIFRFAYVYRLNNMDFIDRIRFFYFFSNRLSS